MNSIENDERYKVIKETLAKKKKEINCGCQNILLYSIEVPGWYKFMNCCLRYPQNCIYSSSDKLGQLISGLSNELNGCDDALVKRPQSTASFEAYRGTNYMPDINNLDILKTAGFTSTSTSLKTAKDYANEPEVGWVLTFIISSEVKGANISKCSFFGNEEEFLLNTDQCFIVSDIDNNSRPRTATLKYSACTNSRDIPFL